MKEKCLICGCENPKEGMKTCCRKCADILKSKKSREIKKCLLCGKEFEVRKSNPKRLCSEECRITWQKMPENIKKRVDLSKEAVKEKFGVDNIFQLEFIKEKSKNTKKNRYGDENFNNPQENKRVKIEKYGENCFKEFSEKAKQTRIKKFGVDHHLKLPEFLNKQKKTNLKRHGVENISQLQETKDKVKATTNEHYGVENASQSEVVKEKKKQTSMDNFGVSHHLKDYNLLQKHFKAQYKVKRYKDTEIYYQGSYELYFLEKMEEKGLLEKVSNGKSYDYIYDGKSHVYHTDFFYNGSNIEIKSGWTYNKNGKDKKLEEVNQAKWKSVIDSGDKINVMLSKQQIDLFVSGIL